jgi:Protease inhibitor Inh
LARDRHGSDSGNEQWERLKKIAVSPLKPSAHTALDGSHRKCRVNLSLDAAGASRALRFPAGCRMALPVLREAGAWTMAEQGSIRLIDAMGQPALELRPNGANRFVATSAKGETYRLEREEETRLANLPRPLHRPAYRSRRRSIPTRRRRSPRCPAPTQLTAM